MAVAGRALMNSADFQLLDDNMKFRVTGTTEIAEAWLDMKRRIAKARSRTSETGSSQAK